MLPWSTVESFPANSPALIETKNGKLSHTELVNSSIPEANAGYWYYNKYFIGSGDLQTVLASSDLDREYPVYYGRRYFTWSDKAQISVDYAVQVGNNTKPVNWDEDVQFIPDPETPRLPKRTRVLRPEETVKLDDPETTRPLFITIHGLTGGSHENYVRAGICEVTHATPEIESVVITARGCNRSKITTPQLFNGAWTEDVRQYVLHVTKTQPKRPIFLAGYSLGGSILANYLGQESSGIPHQVKAAVVVSNPWDLLLCHVSLSQSFIGRRVYMPQMASNLCRLVKNNAKVLDMDPLAAEQRKKLKNITSVHQFDNLMTAPLFGFDGWADYYRTASSVNRLRDIRVPTLVLAARDDPICGDMIVPYEEVKKNPFTHLVTTTHGGHLGWFDRAGGRWYTPVLSKYINAFLTKADLDEPAAAPDGWDPSKRWFQNGRFQLR